MHRLFLIPELLSIICEHVRNEHSNIAGRTLASLARTSKKFHHVATSALWSHLNGLAPLLKTLASDLTYIPEDPATASTWTPTIQRPLMLRRPLKKTEWEAFRSRASRVKHLRVSDSFRPLDLSVIRTLCNPPTTLPLFPNLRSILWNDERPESFSFIRTLSGPTVTSVTIGIVKSVNAWHTTELGILASLPYLCPNVTQFSLPCSAFMNGVSFISEALCTWRKLTEVTCGAIDATALACLAGQPGLRKLSFSLPNNRPWMDTLPSGAFSSVLDFDIHAVNLSFLAAFVDKLEGSPATLWMRVGMNPTPAAVNAFFTTLGRFPSGQLRDLSLRLVTQSRPLMIPNAPPPFQFPHHNVHAANGGITMVGPPMGLAVNGMGNQPAINSHMPAMNPYVAANYIPVMNSHILTINPYTINANPHPPPALSSAAPSTFHALTLRDFSPLTFFGSLGRIDVNVNHGILLNDEDIKVLATAWPHLHSFSLNDTTGWHVKSGISHIGLIAMLEFCPNLQTICIALNTDGMKEVPLDRPGDGVENRAVQKLGLSDSIIEARAVVSVAAFLSDVFPNLSEIAAWDSPMMLRRPNAGGYVDRWTQVCEQVKGMNRVREQERRWWLSGTEAEIDM